ncbi:hypothetical protein [Pseudoalteromonas porphyrae]|uniref:HEAT repeat domain-containing protein n=1 Tax=Pseudoalteromonas porphyrae TaxID=187330 RepID=A0A0N1MUT0_9GAMM|nr:hypothetical protein [Pseudoalteromonas porphyrae]KPH62227.1 hypothetical protein ADS77_13105 [Pseudoalteromonas porphyrae]
MNKKNELEEELSLAIIKLVKLFNSPQKRPPLCPVSLVTSQWQLGNLDYWERFIRDEYEKALSSQPKNIWNFWSNTPSKTTWIDLCSWDGHKREQALRSIEGGAQNRFVLALVCRRLNDWVPQVRQAASEVLSKIIENTDKNDVADVIYFTLSHWSSWKRIDDKSKSILLEVITTPSILDKLKLNLIASPTGPLALIFSQIARKSAIDHFLVDIAHNAIQPSLRAKVYKCLFNKEVSWFNGREWQWTDIRYCKGREMPVIAQRYLTIQVPLVPLLKSAASDRSSIVRRVAAEVLIRELDSLGDESIQLAEQLSLDHAAPVAERGKFALRKIAGSTLF